MQLHTTNTTPQKTKTPAVTMISPDRWLPAALIIGECDCRMLRDQSQSTQHGDVAFIDDTNIYSLFY
jgi:hypothetical protein